MDSDLNGVSRVIRTESGKFPWSSHMEPLGALFVSLAV